MSTTTPAPPFDALVGYFGFNKFSPSRAAKITRETPTQWVEDNGTRWRKNTRRQVGDTSASWQPFRIAVPGDDDFDPAEVRRIHQEAEARVFRGHLRKALDQKTVEDMAEHIRAAAALLTEWETRA